MEKKHFITKFGGYINENNVNEFLKENRVKYSLRAISFTSEKLMFIILPLMFHASYLFWIGEYIFGIMLYVLSGTIFLIFTYYIDIMIYNKTTFFIILKNEDKYSIRGQIEFLGNYSKRWITE